MPRAKTIKTEVLPPESGLSIHTAEALHNHYHRCAQNAAAQATGYAILCGLELRQIRAKLASKGGRPKNSATQVAEFSGGWEQWVKENCEFGISTAKKYMAVADGVKGQIGTKLDGLMELAPSAMNDAQHDKLLKTVSKSTQGLTLQQLYLDFGIVKANPSDNLKKGGKTHTKGRGPSKNVDAQIAEETATQLLIELAKFIQTGQHQLLEKSELIHFDEQLLAAREAIKPYRK